jgi:hypothetical protein
MKNRKIKLIGLVLSILIANVINLFAFEFFPTVPFFEDDKYLEPVIAYYENPNTDLYLLAITCSSTEELINVKDIFIKQAVAELIRNSAFFHGLNAYQPYQQKIYIPSCLSYIPINMDTAEYSGKNDPNSYKEYPWFNQFITCDSTTWDLLQLTLQLVDGEVIILNSVRIPNICMNVPPTCTSSNSLLNTFTTMLPDWNINPPYTTTTPFGMPANSLLIKNNVLQTYTEGTKTINYMNIYEEYALPNDLTFRAVVRKPQIREDSDSLTGIDHTGLFKQIIEKTLLEIIDRPLVDNGDYTVILEFPDLEIGAKDIDYGDPAIGGSMTFNIVKSDEGINLETGTDNCSLAWIPDFGNCDNDFQINTFILIKNVEYLPTDFEYTLDKENYDVGTLFGNHSVTENGAFTYNIPIDITPGTNGAQPSVSLNYNSQYGSGIAGYGWDISAGQSSISRAAKVLNIDSVNRDINFDIYDKLLFNGIRLIPKINSLSGLANSEYIPEVGGDIAKITLKNDLISPYCWFLVEMLDGTKIEYGSDEGSRRKINGKNLSWQIKKVIDPNGNYYEYNYRNQSNNQFLQSIKYSGHINENSIIDVQPYAEIKFYYLKKPDANTRYSNGSKVTKNEILTNIQLLVNDEVYKQYDFLYEYKTDTYLKKIDLIGKNNHRYNSTVFNYNNDSFDDELIVNSININSNNSGMNIPANWSKKELFGDFNGDGLLDRVTIGVCSQDPNNGWYGNSSWYLQLGYKFNNTEIEFGTPINCNGIVLYGCSVEPENAEDQTDNFIDLDNLLVSDLNNDGFDEIVVHRMRKSINHFDLVAEYFLIKYDESSEKLIMSSTPIISDVAYQLRSDNYISINKDDRLIPGDWDGDGFTEIVAFGISIIDQEIKYFLHFYDIVTADGNFNNVNCNMYFDNFYYFSDLGNSGLSPWLDYYIFSSSYKNGKKTLFLSDGDKMVRFKINHNLKLLEIIDEPGEIDDFGKKINDLLLNKDENCYYGDFNGDGNIDIYHKYSTFARGGGDNYYTQYWHELYFWNEKNFSCEYREQIGESAGRPYIYYSYCDSHIFVTDVNSDGKDEIINYNIYTIQNSNELIKPDYSYSIYIFQNGENAKCFSKYINHDDLINHDTYLIGDLNWDPVVATWKVTGIDDNSKNYKTQALYNLSVSQSTKYDLTSRGRAGLYMGGKYISFFNLTDNKKMGELYDGFGNKLEIKYSMINEDDICTKSFKYCKDINNFDIPQLRYMNYGLEVVNSVKSIQSTDADMNNEITYKYSSALFDRFNKTLMGFEKFESTMLTQVNETPLTLNLKNETVKSPFLARTTWNGRAPVYLLLTSKSKVNRPETIPPDETSGSEIKYFYDTWSDPITKRFFVFNKKTEEINYNLQNSTRTYFAYNNYHQLTNKIKTYANYNSNDSISSLKENYFYEFNSNSNILQIKQYDSELRHKDDLSNDRYKRRQKFYYYTYNEAYDIAPGNDKANNLKFIEYDEDKPNHCVRQFFAYDRFGNVLVTQQRDNLGQILNTPKTSAVYDNIGRFATQAIDANGYKSFITTNDLGQIESTTDIQGNTINYGGF